MGYVTLSDRMGENDTGRTWKEVDTAVFKILSHHLPEGIRKNINVSVYLISGLRFEPGTSKTQRSNHNHYTISSGSS